MRYEVVRRLAGEKLEPVRRVLRNHGIMAIFALNMVPAPPFAVQGAIAGACRVPIRHYVLGSILGMAPSLLASRYSVSSPGLYVAGLPAILLNADDAKRRRAAPFAFRRARGWP